MEQLEPSAQKGRWPHQRPSWSGSCCKALLTERIAPLAAVGAVRQQGLMVGIELAPPTDGLRWGRRITAASIERGVLVRPLGDVVVLMPILTSTEEEIERIVDVVADAIEVAAT